MLEKRASGIDLSNSHALRPLWENRAKTKRSNNFRTIRERERERERRER
jgi:hypothetical protein